MSRLKQIPGCKTIPELVEAFFIGCLNNLDYIAMYKNNTPAVYGHVQACRQLMEENSGRKLPDFVATDLNASLPFKEAFKINKPTTRQCIVSICKFHDLANVLPQTNMLMGEESSPLKGFVCVNHTGAHLTT